MRILQELPITIEEEKAAISWGDAIDLAEKHRLTLYDATYLELALRHRLPLATLDKNLQQAAQKENVVNGLKYTVAA